MTNTKNHGPQYPAIEAAYMSGDPAPCGKGDARCGLAISNSNVSEEGMGVTTLSESGLTKTNLRVTVILQCVINASPKPGTTIRAIKHFHHESSCLFR